jgi:hypothetical protein
MISSVREAWRRLRSTKVQDVQPDWSHEVLNSIRWMHQEHVRDLCKLGYSPKEAFWVDFACLPFLPWNGAAHGRMRLSMVFDLYTDLYHQTGDPLVSTDSQAFAALLRQRFYSVQRMVTVSGGLSQDGARVDASGWKDPGQQKWGLAGLIVLWTARQWQEHPSAFPCKLVDD